MIAASELLADSDSGKGSPIGLLVVLVLVIAVYFLWRSMNRHLKKVQNPPEAEQRPDATRAEPEGSGAELPPTDPPARPGDGAGGGPSAS